MFAWRCQLGNCFFWNLNLPIQSEMWRTKFTSKKAYCLIDNVLCLTAKNSKIGCSVGKCKIQSNSILTLEEDHGSRKNCILLWLHTFIYADLQKRIQTVSMVQKWNKKKPFDIVEFSRVVDASGFWYPNLATWFLELVSCKTNTEKIVQAVNINHQA